MSPIGNSSNVNVCLILAPDPTDYGLFAMVILFAGVILNQFLNSFECLKMIPYTLSVMLFGIFIGGIHMATNKGLAGLSYSMERWLDLNPYSLFYLFVVSFVCFARSYQY